MDSGVGFYVHLAVDALVVAVVALAWAAPRLVRVFGRGGGRWRDLARIFTTSRPMPEGARAGQTVMIGPLLYRHAMTVGADEAGIFLAPGFPLALVLRRRLLIPWAQIVKTEPARVFWGKATSLIVGAPVIATLTLEEDLFENMVLPRLSALGKDRLTKPGR
ncbi:hypothetical protein CCR94_16790 [Rhodoblastus sphagnicola]|uniref:Uncharacterized protein n=1 Tax=Rhodoblastus sphagnicola TaxID=333368 RepID=A0A2S6N2J2_9HYPH|nr:hypothetical protein [Rhodoblastus sphagnicola]MBB4199441.1 hypothetical protein [Rhodoblastus sphagnicola]PPQ28833.1 hypothetical protein CCR94_16790 [Rhodoblastus sphagnicola]